MIYKFEFATSTSMTHNFKIFKIVHILHKMGILDQVILDHHIEMMEWSKPAGLVIDYNKCRVHSGDPYSYYQF